MLSQKWKERDLLIVSSILFAVIVVGSFTPMCGCAALKTIAKDTGQCIMANLPETAVGLIPTITAALVAGAINWESQLLALASTFGADFTCALQKSIADLKAAIPPKGEASPASINAILRGQSFLAKHAK